MKPDPTTDTAAFFGTITADATHELNNILSIIGESAGLIHDLFSMTESGTTGRSESVIRSLNAIDRHVQKGVTLLKSLNRLAHTPDREQAEINPREAVEQLVRLCNRSAGRRQVELHLAETACDESVFTHPLPFQMALYTALQICLDTLKAPGDIRIETRPEQEGVSVIFIPRHSDPATPLQPLPAPGATVCSNLEALLQQLSGVVTWTSETGKLHLSLKSLPQKADEI